MDRTHRTKKCLKIEKLTTRPKTKRTTHPNPAIQSRKTSRHKRHHVSESQGPGTQTSPTEDAKPTREFARKEDHGLEGQRRETFGQRSSVSVLEDEKTWLQRGICKGDRC